MVINICFLILIFLFSVAIDSTNLSPPQGDEIKEGQWLGVMVRSQGQGGKVVVIIILYYIFILFLLISMV